MGRGRRDPPGMCGRARAPPNSDLTARYSHCRSAEDLDAPDPSPPPASHPSFIYFWSRGVNVTPQVFRPTCAPSPASAGWDPRQSRQHQGAERPSGAGVGAGVPQNSPRPVLPPPAGPGPLVDSVSPPRNRRTPAEGLGTCVRAVSARAGQGPALQAQPHPPRGESLSWALPGPAPPKARREPSPLGAPAQRLPVRAQAGRRTVPRRAAGRDARVGAQVGPHPAGLPSLQVTDVLSRRCRRRSSLSCCAEQGYRD